jgi:hypothetical protein
VSGATLTAAEVEAARTGRVRLRVSRVELTAAMVAEINRKWDAADDFVALMPARRIDTFRPHNGTPRSVTLPHPWYFERGQGDVWRAINAHSGAVVPVRGVA